MEAEGYPVVSLALRAFGYADTIPPPIGSSYPMSVLAADGTTIPIGTLMTIDPAATGPVVQTFFPVSIPAQKKVRIRVEGANFPKGKAVVTVGSDTVNTTIHDAGMFEFLTPELP